MKNINLLTALIFTVSSYTTFPIAKPLSPASPTVTTTTATYPPLHTKGPYLTYLKEEADHQSIVYTDPDGYGRKVVALPSDVHLESIKALSPDGSRVVYYTGSETVAQDGTKKVETYDLALNILNVSTAKVETTVHLLSKDYPNNFVKAEAILAPTPSDDPFNDINSRSLYFVFSEGIRAMSWSPSGRYLAFAGQMNGLSSDVYVLDRYTQAIQQLSDGPEEISYIGQWSNDEQQVGYLSTLTGPQMGDSFPVGTAYVAHLNGNSELYHYQRHGFINNLSDTENAYTGKDNMGSFDDLLVYSSVTKSVDVIWKGCLFNYAADRQSQTILFAPMTQSDRSESGLVLYDRVKGTSISVAPFEGWNIQPWHTPTFRYLAENFQGQLLAVAADGKTQVISENHTLYDISPDNKWLVLYGEGPSGLSFYTPDAKLAAEIKDVSVDDIIWLGGSQAMFLKSGNTLMYLNTSDFKPVVVDQDLENYFSYTWMAKVAK